MEKYIRVSERSFNSLTMLTTELCKNIVGILNSLLPDAISSNEKGLDAYAQFRYLNVSYKSPGIPEDDLSFSGPIGDTIDEHANNNLERAEELAFTFLCNKLRCQVQNACENTNAIKYLLVKEREEDVWK